MSELRESGNIEQNANVIFYRDDYHERRQNLSNRMVVIISKHRNGL
ncbi:hypothetical protein CVR97_28250 [Salmonella enterica subsp. enterica serovar Typhimurium]|nr:hypothetical protein CVR97_28250 [Salmonella enterica subsp. enterica serovar Typhimurium]